MRYQFIREHDHEYSVQRMCRVLEVTRSGYYAWQPEKTGPRAQENQVLVEHIRKEYKTSRQTYGSPTSCTVLWDRITSFPEGKVSGSRSPAISPT